MKSKQTHTVQDIENLMFDYTNKIRDAETKTEKQALLKKLKSLEQHYNSCQDKHFNDRKLPVKKVPKDIPKKELLALIDDVEVRDMTVEDKTIARIIALQELDVTGVFPPFTKPQT